MPQEEWGTVKKYSKDGMTVHLLHDESEAIYVFILAMFVRIVEANWYLEDWLGYCLLP